MIHATANQMSMFPLFGVVDHPDAVKYNAAVDLWAEKFGMYAKLERFTPQMTSTSQSFEQLDRLIAAVSDERTARELLSIDTGFRGLNTALKNFVSRAQMSAFDRAMRVNTQRSLAAHTEHEAQAAASLERQKERLAQLELKEKLLAHESEFKTEKAARSSSLVKQAQSIDGIAPVVTEKKTFVWNRNVSVLEQHKGILLDKDGKSDQGHFVYSYTLTFEEVAA